MSIKNREFAKIALGVIVLWFALTLFLSLFAYKMYSWLNIPEVHMSYATGECIRIVENVNTTSPTIKDCSEMPEKFNLIWNK